MTEAGHKRGGSRFQGTFAKAAHPNPLEGSAVLHLGYEVEAMAERWKQVPGFEGVYEVSDQGGLRSLERINHRGSLIRGRVFRRGAKPGQYPRVSLRNHGKSKTYLLHKLVLEAFDGPRPAGMECRHLDGNPNNARLSNLRWGTAQANADDRQRHDTVPRGEVHHATKLSDADVRGIRQRREKGISVRSIAAELSVSMSTVSSISNRRSRADVDSPGYKRRPKYRKKATRTVRLKTPIPSPPDGEAEGWKPIVGYENLYEVSNLARVRSLDRIDSRGRVLYGRVMKLYTSPSGYMSVGLSRDGDRINKHVHRLVLSAFCRTGRPGEDCCHVDGDRGNNRPGNLKWGSRRENMADRDLHDTTAWGERNGSAKVDLKTVREIRKLRAGGCQLRVLSDTFGLSISSISGIVRNKSWRRDPLIKRNDLIAADDRRTRLSEDEVRCIRSMSQEGERAKDIAAKFLVTRSCISNVISRRSFRSIPTKAGEYVPGEPRAVGLSGRMASAKLDERAVRAIRVQYQRGVTQQDLGDSFRVNRSTISYIVQRKTWGHIPSEKGEYVPGLPRRREGTS